MITSFKRFFLPLVLVLTCMVFPAHSQGHKGFLETNWIEAAPGTPAPLLNIQNPDGTVTSLADFQAGRTVVVNFWATWCGPCREEMPTLDALAQEQFDGGEHVVLAVALERDPQAAQRFLDNLGADDLVLALDVRQGGFRALASQGDELAQLTGLPATFIIRPDGTLQGVLPGPADWNSDFAQSLVESSIDGDGS